SGICIPWPQVYGVTADVPQGAKDLSAIVGTPHLAQSFAAGLISCESGEMIIGPPARELGPLDGLELAAREFQRPLGRCGVGRQTCDHAAPRGVRKPTLSLQASNRIADANPGPGGAS